MAFTRTILPDQFRRKSRALARVHEAVLTGNEEARKAACAELAEIAKEPRVFLYNGPFYRERVKDLYEDKSAF
jgi:hypothetical protein